MNIKEEILTILKNSQPKVFSNIVKSKKSLYNEVLELTKFLDNNVKLSERCYCVLNDITSYEQIKCKGCGKVLKFKSILDGYFSFCRSCVLKQEEVKNKIKQTNIEKYGVENPSKSNIIKDKISKANKDVKEKALERRKKTCLERYGVDTYTQTDEYKEKFKNKKREK